MKSARASAGQPYSLSRRILLFAGSILLLCSIAVMIGWNYDIAPLKTVFPKLTPMNPMTAFCFIFVGGLFIGLSLPQCPPKLLKALAILASGTTLLVGGLMLLHYASGYDARIDHLLFAKKLSINRMAPSTALCFFMTGIAILMSQFFKKLTIIVRGLSFVIIFIATYTLIGYAYGLQPVYGVAVLNPMALHVAVLFIITAVGLISLVTGRFVLYITKTLVGIYLVALLIFITLSVYSFKTFNRLSNNNVLVQQNYQQQLAVSDLRNALVDAETGQRGYIITGIPSYLEPYTNAVQRESKSLQTVRQLPPSVISSQDLKRLTELSGLRLAVLKQVISIRDQQGSMAATKFIIGGTGKAYMDQIRTILDASDANIRSQVKRNSAQAITQNSKTLVLLAFSTASILALLVASLYFLQANLKHQHDMTDAADADRESTLKVNDHLKDEVSDRLVELERVKASLETEVAKRTADLATELDRTQKLNSFMIDRELRIKALKDEIIVLKSAQK